jgi:hypothetical protein
MKKAIKLAIAASMLGFATSAHAMPQQVPDRYYEHYWGFLYFVVTAHRPCVGPENMWCNG